MVPGLVGFVNRGWFSYGQTIMAEVSPAPKMYLFMSLYNTVGVSIIPSSSDTPRRARRGVTLM